VKNYFAGQLFAGKQTNEFTLLNQGVADFAFGSTINWSPQVKELNLFAMPFMYPSYQALDAVQGGEPGQRLFKIIESKGVIPLAWAENGFRQITNSKRAVRKPEDLKDLKIRVVGSPIFIDTFRALGANPVNMNWGEAQQAFQQGTVDGQENPVVSVIIPFKLWTSQKHLTAWHYAIDPVIIAVSKLTWDGLTPADREIVRKTAVEMAAWEKAGARKGLADSTAAYDELRKNGMEVVTLTPADLAAFREKTKPVYDKWVTEVGADLVKSAEAIIAKTK
jgi:tripartite ATP-independent transporter DctP family solute receptor